MSAHPIKTDADRVHDANEIIRKLNIDIRGHLRTIKDLHHEHDTAEKIRKEIWNIAAHNPEPPEWLTGKGGKIGARGCPITVWSDNHYGETVDLDINKYNVAIAKKRLFRLFDTTVDLSYEHMGRAKTEYPGIIVCLGGDMVGGDIHEELIATNDRTPHQAVNEMTDILAAGIEKMASKFGKVYVPCVVGNHGRSHKKPPFKQMIYSNYDWSIYCNLLRFFQKEKHIRIDVANGADAHFTSYGVHYMLTHGDNLGVKGGDGIIGAIGPIMRGSIKLGQQTHKLGLDFDELIMCHWHQMLWLPGVTVNNAAKGADEYAMFKLRARPSRPSQALWFNHPEHGTTARWEIFLEGRKKATDDKQWVSWLN
jgi:hypothetical protein